MESDPKLCECGCGKPAPIAKATEPKRGYVKGLPHRFCQGHGRRGLSGAQCGSWIGGRVRNGKGYILARSPGHPRATANGYVFEHVLVAEKAFGGPLPKGAEVHHFSEVKSDNRNENLVICQDRAYHMLLHQRARAYAATGDPASLRCRICSQWGGEDLSVRKNGNAYHRSCNAQLARMRTAQKEI